MAESVAYTAFKKCLQPLDRVDRVENIMLVGMPDVNCCIEGVEIWVENKCPKEPKRGTTPLFGSNHKLTQEQKNWILRQLNAGGNAVVFIATDKRYILMDGAFADGLNEMTVQELVDKARWHSTIESVSKDKWNKLRSALVSLKIRL